MDSADAQFLSPKEIAARLSVKVVTVYAWIREGRLPAVRLGPRCVRVRATDLDRFINEAPSVSPDNDLAVSAPRLEQDAQASLVSARSARQARELDKRGRLLARLPSHMARLFFDVDPATVSPATHARAIVERVLESGDERDVSWMMSTYEAAFVREVAETSRRLSPRSAAFWRLMMERAGRHAS